MLHKKLRTIAMLLAGAALGGAAGWTYQTLATGQAAAQNAKEKEGPGDVQTKVPVTFSGGHDTEPQDKGRPVVLIAAALGVKPEVFRAAFRGVTPAREGKPTPEQAKSNKAALMKALAPYGVTNERLDEVSDYYRYKPGKDQVWRSLPAKGYALVEQGKIKQIITTEPGSGYSMPPRATVLGLEAVPLKVTLHFDKDLKKNGAVASVEVASAEDRQNGR